MITTLVVFLILLFCFQYYIYLKKQSYVNALILILFVFLVITCILFRSGLGNEILIEIAGNKLQVIKRYQSEAEQSLKNIQFAEKEIRKTLDFLTTASRARDFDQPSFRKIREIASDSENALQQDAKIVFDSIMANLLTDHLVLVGSPSWREGVNYKQLTLPQLEEEVEKALPAGRSSALHDVWQRQDLLREDRLKFLLKIAKNEKMDMGTIVTACQILAKETGIDFDLNHDDEFLREVENRMQK